MEWVDPLVRLVTAGGFGALVWYLVIKHMPAERQQFLEQLEKRDRQFDDLIERYHKTQEQTLKSQVEWTQVVKELKAELKRHG